MPIDPSIPLGVRPAPIDNPLDAQAKIMGLRSLAQQQQAQQIDAQQRQVQLAVTQRALGAQNLTAQLVRQHTSLDPDTGLSKTDHQAVYNDLAAVYPDQAAAYLETADKAEQSANSWQISNLTTQRAQQKFIGDLIDNVRQASPAQRQATWDTMRGIAQTAFGHDGQTSQFLASLPAAVPDDATLDHWADLGKTQQEKLEDAAKAADTRLKTAQAAKTETETAPGWQDAFKAQVNTLIPDTDKDNAALKARTLSRINVATTRAEGNKALEDMSNELRALEVATNPKVAQNKINVSVGEQEGKDAAYAKMYQPTVDAQGNLVPNSLAKAVADYRTPPPSTRSMAQGPGKALMDEVTRLNPAYDATQYQNRQKTRIAYTTGTEGQQINALNTAIMHMDLLADAADALHNGTFKPGNAAYNAVSTLFGGTAPKNYEQIKEYLDGEVGSVVKKGVATEGEFGRQASIGDPSSAADQLRSYIQNAVRVMGGKGVVLDDKYHAVMGKQDPFAVVSDRSKAILQKHGFDPDHPEAATKPPATGGTAGPTPITVTDPAGGVHAFATQAQAEAFKRLIAAQKP